jgi:hypothetical protein
MASRERPDPVLETLRRLPPVADDSAATVRVRRRCHDAMARRAAHQTRHRGDVRPGRWPDAVLVLSMSAYLVAVVSTALRLAGAP